MTEILEKAAEALREKMEGQHLDGSIKLDFSDEDGALRVEGDTVSISDDEADCTLTASSEVFQNMFDGEENPTVAFMSGKLKVDGNMGLAMKLGGMLG